MDVTISAGFSGRPYDLRMRIYTIENNVGANYSRYRGDRYAYSRSGYGSYANNSFTVNSWIAGHHAGGAYSLPFAPGDYAGKTIGLGSYDTGGVGHDGNGNLYFTSRIQMSNASVFGSADTGDVGMWGDRLPAAPGAPGWLSVGSITPTSVTLSWGAASRGRADITNYRWEVWLAGGSAMVVSATGGVFYSDNTADNGTLTPGTSYAARVAAQNSDGWGPWQGWVTFSTLPSTPPGMTLTPSLSGTSTTVTLTPPGGATGVTKYTVERRPVGGSATSSDTTSNSLTVSGLTPGGAYEWRSSAWFGSYQSPWTAWSGLVQPNPNTNPGDYFDGSTAARGDLTFAWTSTVNNSTSEARGVGVDGWIAYISNARTTGRVQRVTGGRSGQYAARLLFPVDATISNNAIGMDAATLADRAPVEENALYVGSIYVRPSRAQRFAAEILFYDAAGTQVGSTVLGTSALVSDTIGWTRLTVSTTAPVGADTAIVRARDVGGTGYVSFKSGEWFDADDVMVSLATLFDYFDGNTPDVPGYDYAWLGTPNASTSARFETAVAAVDPLADPDCPAPPAPPALPTIAMDCIEEVGTWRRYSLTIPASEVRQWSSTLPTLVLTTQGAAERQVRIRYYPNPDGLPVEEVTQDGWDAELILTYIPPNTEITLDGVTQIVTASVAGADPIPANRLLYGTGGIPATWPELRCGVGYVVTMDVPLDAPAGNLDSRVIVTQRM